MPIRTAMNAAVNVGMQVARAARPGIQEAVKAATTVASKEVASAGEKLPAMFAQSSRRCARALQLYDQLKGGKGAEGVQGKAGSKLEAAMPTFADFSAKMSALKHAIADLFRPSGGKQTGEATEADAAALPDTVQQAVDDLHQPDAKQQDALPTAGGFTEKMNALRQAIDDFCKPADKPKAAGATDADVQHTRNAVEKLMKELEEMLKKVSP